MGTCHRDCEAYKTLISNREKRKKCEKGESTRDANLSVHFMIQVSHE